MLHSNDELLTKAPLQSCKLIAHGMQFNDELLTADPWAYYTDDLSVPIDALLESQFTQLHDENPSYYEYHGAYSGYLGDFAPVSAASAPAGAPMAAAPPAGGVAETRGPAAGPTGAPATARSRAFHIVPS
jgi:hypothetical protein